MRLILHTCCSVRMRLIIHLLIRFLCVCCLSFVVTFLWTSLISFFCECLGLQPVTNVPLKISCFATFFFFLSTTYILPHFEFSRGHLFIFLCHPHLTCLHFHCCWTPLKCLSPHRNPLYLLSEGTVTAPAGHLAVVKAAQTVTWSAWSLGPGAVQIQTAPTVHSGHLSPRPAASLASPSLPEGIALEATKAPRVAAKALVPVRTW